ncbi:hypothetical protein M441DRAFT_100264, partial [Trichoderma asperellum CBS 433.97]
FLGKISKTDPFYDRKRILDLKGPFLHESFEWILNHDDFQKWRNTKESGALWIKGDPGKGKIMLLCGIIDDLGKNPGINSNFCYFFFQATDNRINSAVAAIGGLILSLLKPRQKLVSAIRKKFGDTISQLSGPNAWQVLCDIFETIAQNQELSDIVCIIDALDECENDVRSLLNLIVKTTGHVKWLLSSRNVKDIERRLRKIKKSQRLTLELKANAECVSQSVDAYIGCSIQDIEALEGDGKLQIQTANTLKMKAEGTFLWVSLVIELLRETDRRNIADVLEELPIGLENLYDLIMERSTQKSRHKDQNICLLSIVTTAERPLRLEELREFIKRQWKGYKTDYSLHDMSDTVKDCGSFLSIRDDTVYFVHQSVKDYMVGKAAKSIFPSGIAYQHSEMFKNSLCAMSCILTYDIYNIKDPKTEGTKITRPDPDPLASMVYCCTFWVEHLVQSCQLEKSNVEEHLRENGILHCFLKVKFLCWLESLILLNAVEQGLEALNKLESITARQRRNNSLEQFIDDAWQFIHNCEEYVRTFPLQLYYAAFVFGDSDNTINKTFRQAIHAKFGYLPVFTNKPRRRYSRLQVIKSKQHFTSLHFSPDSSLLGLLHYDTLSFWRPKSGVREFEFQLNLDEEGMEINFEPDTSHHIAFSSDSSQLISVSSKGVVQRWSINNRTQIEQSRLNLYSKSIEHISVDSKLVAAMDHQGCDINIIAAESGKVVRVIKSGNSSEWCKPCFSTNLDFVARRVGDKDDVQIWDVNTGKVMQVLQGPGSKRTKIAFSYDSNYLVAGYEKSQRHVRIWCVKSGE